MRLIPLILCCCLVGGIVHDCGVTPEWEKQLTEEVESARRLQTVPAFKRSSVLGPIRIAPYYYDMTQFDATVSARVRDVIMPSVLKWYSNILSVYTLDENWKMATTSCTGYVTVPAEHLNPGLANVDLVIYVVSINDTSKGYIAKGGFCAQDGNTLQNPTAGLLQINFPYYSSLSTDMEITVLRHEVMHILGFSNSLFTKFRRSDGSLYDSTSASTVLRDSTVTMLTTPAVTSRARAAYNCNTLAGFELENYGSTGTASSHWEKRIILNDFMLSTLTMDAIYSDVTFAVLEDSGWYKVDYSYTDPIVFGRDKNCDFFTKKCVSSGVAQFSDYCVTPSNNECSTSYTRKASCNVGNWTAAVPSPYQYFTNPLTAGMDSTADFCPFRDPFGNGDCKNRSSLAAFYQPVLFGEQLCDTCMCFTGTYILQYRVVANPLHSGCHNVTCDNGVAKVTIASNQITCPVEGGQVSNIPGYPGYINCPPYERLCGDRPCINSCFGYGKCVRGNCQCSDGYSLIDCSLICHETCRKCTGKTSAECASCYPNAHLSAGACLCNDGFAYNSTQQRCSPCHTSCLTCSALSQYDCVTCVPHASKAPSGTCVCDPGYTRSSDGSTCVPCYPTCATCSGTGVSDCTSCRANAAVAGGIAGTCNCNSGYYFKADYMCGACHVSCKECTSDTATSCTACKPQSAFVSSGSCVCPAYFYLSSDGTQCLSCHITCYTCTESSASSCLTCKAPTATVTAGVCNCPLGFYMSAADCLSCDVTCKGCVAAGPTACSSCKPLTAIFSNGVCSCPARYYMTSDGTQCLDCNVNCQTCVAAGSASCTSCYPLATLTPSPGPGSCLCAERFYYQPPSGCLPCHYSCKTCVGASSAQCVTCNAGPAASGECKCVNGQFMSQTGDCQPCSANCVTCVDTSTKCTACDPAVATLAAGTCQCLSSAFLSASTLCVPCHVTCLTCKGAASTECSTCVANATLQGGSCPCTSGFTRSATLTQCVPCHHTCTECAGTQANQCTTCPVGATIVGQAPWYCTCVDGYFTTSTSDCSICSVNCRTCTDTATKCTACDPSVAQLTNGVCACIPGAYLSSTTACLPCNVSCVTCTAGTASACTSCAAHSHLSASPGTCLCDSSYFPNPTARTCAHCEASCKECTGPSATECRQCYPLASLSDKNSCECNFGYFPFGSTADCRICDRLCGNCVGAQPTDCTDCPQWARLAGHAPSYCLCQDGYFPDPDVATCSACDSSCGTCTGDSPFLCLTCANGHSWVSGLYCLSVCPAGHSSASGSCAPSLSLGFRLQLDKVAQKPLDSVGLRIIQSGSGGDQDSSDPTAYYLQGWLFDGVDDYAALPGNLLDSGNIVLDSTHTIEVWVRPAAAGCVLSKSVVSGSGVNVIYKVCVTGTGALLAEVLTVNISDPSIKLTRTASGGNVAFKTAWTAVTVRLAFKSKSSTTLSISINQVEVSTATYTGEVFKDTTGSYDTVKFLAGATATGGSTFGSYFKGHIAEISIWNSATATATAAGCTCSQCSTGGLCLSPCQATEYQSPTGCSACLSTCTSGCIRGTDCRMNVDPLCRKFTSFVGCDECADLAAVDNSACKCIVNTDSVGDDCQCQVDYPRTGGQCGECRNYLDPTEVAAYFHSSYLLVIVAFQRPMVTAAVNNCGDVFAADTLLKMGEEATCAWAGDSLSIAVFLGTNPTIVNEQISLRSTNLYAQGGTCKMTASVLRPTVAYTSPLPIPVAALSLPNTFSIPCSTSGTLELDASGSYGGKGRPLNYTWSLSCVDPPFSQVYATTDSLLKVRKEVLPAGMLQVMLTVKNFAGGESQASGQVLVTAGEALTIKVEGGDTFSLKSTESREVNLNTFSLCPRNSSLLFTWRFLDTSHSPPSDLSFLPSNSPSDSITIPDHSLPAGSSYRFVVNATDGVFAGGAVFTANVLKSDLVAALDRVSSDVNVGTDFVVSGANSTDPDNAQGTLNFLWMCLDGGKPCTDPNGTVVVVNAMSATLTLSGSRLKANSTWNVTLSVSKDTRTASKSLLLTIKSNVTTSFLNLYPTPSRLNSQQKNTISLAVSTLASTTFLWKQEIGSTLPLLTPLTYPYLSIAAFAMKFGDTYGFALTATNAGGVSTARVAFTANYPPSGGTCTISPKTGIALSTVFEVVSSNWEDVEGDLPLYYTVVYLYKTWTITLGKTSLSSYFSFKSGIGTYDFYVFVWDSLKSYRQVPVGSITVTLARQLLAVNVLEAFVHDITDQDLTYQMALAYSSVYEFDNATLTGVVSTLAQHIASVAAADSSELDALLGTVSTLMQQRAANATEPLRSLLSLVDSAVGKMQGTVSDQQLAVLLRVVEDAYSVETEDMLRGVWRKWAGGAAKALLPDQVPLKFSGKYLSSYYQRLAAPSLSKRSISFSRLRLSVPSDFLPYLNSNSVFDLHLDTVSRPDNTSDEVSLSLYASGQFRNFAFEPSATPSELLVRIASAPLTLVFPLRRYQQNATYECQHFSQGSGWVSDGMNLTDIDSEAAVCSASLLSTFRVSERVAEEPSTPPAATVPGVLSLHCNRNVAPIAMSFSLLFLGVLLVVYLKVTDPLKAAKVAAHWSEPHEFQVSKEPEPQAESQAFKENRHTPTLSSAIPTPTEGPMVINYQESFQMTFSRLFCESHGIIGMWIFSTDLLRWSKAAILTSSVLVEMSVIGAFSERDEGAENFSMRYIWDSYGWTDVRAVLVALAVGLATSAVLMVMFTTARRRTSETSESTITVVASAVAVAFVVTALAMTVLQALDLCFEEGGRWAIGAIGAVAGEALVNQSLLALGRATALTALSR